MLATTAGRGPVPGGTRAMVRSGKDLAGPSPRARTPDHLLPLGLNPMLDRPGGDRTPTPALQLLSRSPGPPSR